MTVRNPKMQGTHEPGYALDSWTDRMLRWPPNGKPWRSSLQVQRCRAPRSRPTTRLLVPLGTRMRKRCDMQKWTWKFSRPTACSTKFLSDHSPVARSLSRSSTRSRGFSPWGSTPGWTTSSLVRRKCSAPTSPAFPRPPAGGRACVRSESACAARTIGAATTAVRGASRTGPLTSSGCYLRPALLRQFQAMPSQWGGLNETFRGATVWWV